MVPGKLTREQYARWEGIYQTKWRQLRRWHLRGAERDDVCPFDFPAKMPSWWVRNFNQSCPAKILAAAARAAKLESEPTEVVTGDSAQSTETPMDIESYGLEEGEAIRQQRAVVAAHFAKIKECMKRGWPADKAQSDYLKSLRVLREYERDAREAGAQAGKYIPRESYERDATAAAELLSAMHDSMNRRVLEHCQSVPERYHQVISKAVRDALGFQRRILQRLTSPSDELLSELAA